eukprot:7389624-Prymnesium_polylepis.1
MVSASDAYSAGIAGAFRLANRGEMALSTEVRFAEHAVDLSQETAQLRQSGARVILLFTLAKDGSNFVRAALAAGVGGEGFIWLSGDSVLTGIEHWSGDPLDHERAFRGFLAMEPSNGQGTAAHDAYMARRRQLPPMLNQDGSCSLETDDTGRTY